MRPDNRSSADLLCQLHDDPLRAAQVAEAVTVLVTPKLTNELRTLRPQAVKDSVDVLDREGDMADTGSVGRRALRAPLSRRGMELGQFEPSATVRCLQHRDVSADAVETDDPVHPVTLNRCLVQELEPELQKECDGVLQVLDDYADMFQPQDRHAPDRTGRLARASGVVVPTLSGFRTGEGGLSALAGTLGASEGSLCAEPGCGPAPTRGVGQRLLS